MGCYPDMAPAASPWALAPQGFGGGAGFGVRPVLTSLSEPIKNYKKTTAAARDWVLPLALGCYPDMAPAASPWALAAILTWHRHRVCLRLDVAPWP